MWSKRGTTRCLVLRVVGGAEDLAADEAVPAGGDGTEGVAEVGIEVGGDVGSDDLPLLHPAAISTAAPATATRRDALTRPVWSMTRQLGGASIAAHSFIRRIAEVSGSRLTRCRGLPTRDGVRRADALPVAQPQRTASTSRLTTAGASGVAMGVAAATTLPTLGRQPLSWDEAVTLSAAQRRLPELLALLRHTDAPLGTYYAFIHAWLAMLRLVGIDPTGTWLRLPSALAATGAVGLLVVIAARWFSVRTALLAGVLFAVHPMLTFYAQDARPYAMVACAYLASTWALLRALDRPTIVRLACYALLATVTIYLHLFAVYALAAHVVLVAGAREYRRRWVFVGAVIAAAAVPLLIVAHGESPELSWIPRPSFPVIGSVVAHMFGGVTLVAALFWLGVLAIRHGALPRDRRAVLLGVWLLVPVAALVTVDFFTPDLVARYGLVSVPAAALLVAAAATGTRARSVRALAAVIVVIAAVTTAVQQARPFKYEDYRSAADVIGDLAQPGDAVMFLPMSTRVGYEAYQTTEPGLRNVEDLAMLPGTPPVATSRIGGVDRPPAALSTVFRRAQTIFLLGDSTAQARRALHDPTDLAQQAALAPYRISRSPHYGDLYLTVLQRGSPRQPAAHDVDSG
jgi:mannosyltransferase